MSDDDWRVLSDLAEPDAVRPAARPPEPPTDESPTAVEALPARPPGRVAGAEDTRAGERFVVGIWVFFQFFAAILGLIIFATHLIGLVFSIVSGGSAPPPHPGF